MKTWFKRLHLACALLAGFFLINLTLSAALLLFAKDLQQLLQPQHWQLQSAPSADAALADNLSQQVVKLQTLAAQSQRSIQQIQIDTQPNWPWQVVLSDGRQWNYDPAQQRIIHRLDQGSDLYHWALYWHRWLLFSNDNYIPWVRHLISSAALLLMSGLLLGYGLWLLGKSPLKRLRIKPLKKRHGRFYQYHLLSGVVIGLPLMLIAFTGLSFNWPTQSIFEAATVSKLQPRRNDKPVTVGGLEQLQASLQKAQESLPQAQIRRIYLPKTADQPLLVRLQYEWEQAPFSYAWLDAGNAELLTLYDSAKAPAANYWWDFKYAFHAGLWLGKVTTWLWLLLLAGLSFLLLSGYYLYFKRRVRLSPRKSISEVRTEDTAAKVTKDSADAAVQP